MSSPCLNVPHAERLYIGGRWVAPSTTETFPVLNCATEDVVARVAQATEADVAAAAQAARKAFNEGA